MGAGTFMGVGMRRSLAIMVVAFLVGGVPLAQAAKPKPAPAGETAYVQASSIKLRAKGDAKAKSKREMPINTKLTVLERQPDGWCRVKAQDQTGFVKCEMVAAAPAKLESLMATADGVKQAMDARFNAADRALVLAPLNKDVQQRFRERMFDAEFARLAQIRKEGGTRPRSVPCPEWEKESLGCVRRLGSDEHGGPVEAVVRGADAVVMNFWTGKLTVMSGRMDRRSFVVELQYKSNTNPRVTRALFGKEGDGASDCWAPELDSSGVDGCQYEFAQNCAPDTCWDDLQSCSQGCSEPCGSCANECGSTCNDCENGCAGKPACLERCMFKVHACKQGCMQAKASCEKDCGGPYDACARQHADWWKNSCESDCNAWMRCHRECDDDECRNQCPTPEGDCYGECQMRNQ